MGLKKKLSIIGNSMGLIIDKSILDLLGIDSNTELDISTDGQKLIINPIFSMNRESVKEIHKKVIKKHSKTFEKLSE